MPRYIDADALMKVIREHDYPLRSHFNSTDNGMFTIGVQQAVDDAPTIDAVEVVFCKDCIYQKDATVNSKGFIICPVSNMEITDDDYCSYGEKMDEVKQ